MFMSRPSRARELKPAYHAKGIGKYRVAPLAGAWIETWSKTEELGLSLVAPLAGAWIETLATSEKQAGESCRAPRGRVNLMKYCLMRGGK